MFQTIKITDFRGFSNFRLHDLGRVNLLVGTNNSGKTSILEAIELLASRGDASRLWSATSRRGERMWQDDVRRREAEADIVHLFHGHDIDIGSRFRIDAHGDSGEDFVEARIEETGDAKDSPRSLFEPEGGVVNGTALALVVLWGRQPDPLKEKMVLTNRGGVRSGDLLRPGRLRRSDRRVQFIPTASMSVDRVVAAFDEIVLTPEEDLLIESLRTIEPGIERIASVSADRQGWGASRGGIVVKCKGIEQRIPIGSMGDGIWRMLGLAVALVTAENGILLVDEIDTGLHYSVMADMWKLVKRTSERLNVQVFATTHSRDCYESLAAISRESAGDGSQVTIQRIERDRPDAVVFTEQEIVIASERGLEVR